MKRRTLGRQGVSLVEIIIGLVMFSFVGLSVAATMSYFSKQNVRNKDKSFATQKAIQLMEELRSYPAQSDISVAILDQYDDGGAYNPMLTTLRDVVATNDPGNPISGNPQKRFVRRVEIRPVPDQPLARQVYVRVYRNGSFEPLAETMSIIRNISEVFPPTQVHDLYVLAIDNVTSFWSTIGNLLPMLRSTVQDLELRNPGLQYRVHVISRLAYGRDRQYKPYINKDKSAAYEMPWVYFYPGTIPTAKGESTTTTFFQSSRINGMHFLDDTLQNGSPVGRIKYSVADQFNHAVRYPEEEELYQDDLDEAAKQGMPAPEMSLRMFLQQMIDNPNRFRNAMIINLHAELLPFVPMRNYSDAAKDPRPESSGGLPNLRVVTHPERLQYDAPIDNTNPLRLRVYSFLANPSMGNPKISGNPITSVPVISILINQTLSPSDISMEFIDEAYARKTDGDIVKPSGSEPRFVVKNPSANQTLIELYETPFRHDKNGDLGLAPSKRLYNMEYIPCPLPTGGTGDPLEFRDLATPDDPLGPPLVKNTNRWRISINKLPNPSAQVSIKTWIGDTASPEYPNLSETYSWVQTAVPFSEQFQFVGDPRHVPYMDVVTNEGYNWFFRSLQNAPDYANAFDRATSVYRDSWNTPADFRDGLNVNLPAYYGFLRAALLSSNAFFNSTIGQSFTYIGQGGDLTTDLGTGVADKLNMISTPFRPAASTPEVFTIDELATRTLGVKKTLTEEQPAEEFYRLITSENLPNAWASLPWLGELYPDSEYAIWQGHGNLPTRPLGPGKPRFYRAKYFDVISPTGVFPDEAGGFVDSAGNGALRYPGGMPALKGAASFFNGSPEGNANGFFCHSWSDPQLKTEVGGTPDDNGDGGSEKQPKAPAFGTIETKGVLAYSMFRTPPTSTIWTRRPFRLDMAYGNPRPLEWDDPIYQNTRTELDIQEKYFDSIHAENSGSSGYTASGLIQLTQAGRSAFVLVNGFAQQDVSGAGDMAKTSLMLLTRAFLAMGNPNSTTIAQRSLQIPLVSIQQPEDNEQIKGSVIPLRWTTNWTRWSNANVKPEEDTNYTEEYKATKVTPLPLTYQIKYSLDNQQTWSYFNSGGGITKTRAEPGVRNPAAANNLDLMTNSEMDIPGTTQSMDLSIPGLKKGSCIIRIEAFRKTPNNRELLTHYAVHQRRFFIDPQPQ